MFYVWLNTLMWIISIQTAHTLKNKCFRSVSLLKITYFHDAQLKDSVLEISVAALSLHCNPGEPRTKKNKCLKKIFKYGEQYPRQTFQSLILFSPKCSTFPNTFYLRAFQQSLANNSQDISSTKWGSDKISRRSCEWKISADEFLQSWGQSFLQSPSGLTCSRSFLLRYQRRLIKGCTLWVLGLQTAHVQSHFSLKVPPDSPYTRSEIFTWSQQRRRGTH